MKKQIFLKMAAAGIFLALLVSEALLISHLRDHTEQNVRMTGEVRISIHEPAYEQREAQTEKEQGQHILVEQIKPGEEILRDPTIYVEQESKLSYIRTQIVIRGLPEYQKKDLLSQIQLEKGWNYNAEDGYYYFEQPVSGGAVIPFFTSVHIPDEWKDMQSSPSFQIRVIAEAVQSPYLTPVLSANCQVLSWILYGEP